MKLEIENRESKYFYDEVYFIVNNINKFIKRPKKKTYYLTKYLIFFDIYLIIASLMFILFLFMTKDTFYLVLIFLFIAASIFVFRIYKNTVKRIVMNMLEPGTKYINIDEEKIQFEDDKKILKVKWDNVSSIIINRASICILPKTLSDAIVTIGMDYKEELLKYLKKIKKDNFVVDNSNLYK